MRKWIPSQVYRDETHAAEVLTRLISHYESGGDPRKGPLVLGVALKASNKLVGHIGFSPFEGAVEIAYAIERAHQRVGLAAEAARVACHWVTHEYSINTILGVAARANIASRRTLIRTGFVLKGERVIRLQGKMQAAAIFEFYADRCAQDNNGVDG